MRKRSNQRITKIKKDFILDLLKRAEAVNVANATSIQPPGSDLIPYPDMDNLRLWVRDYLLKGLTKIYPVNLTEDGQTYLTTIIDGLPLFTKLTKTISEDGDETSKPGLWLSNLCAPHSASSSGSWLRQNLENNYSNTATVNSDTIGNYSFSFLQRGIFRRTAGSTHSDKDSFCQHWSPSALSCISQEAIIIPFDSFANTYSCYQTLVTPVNPDKQYYEESVGKTVDYNFVDNNNNIPLTTTNFNGKLVGSDWTYELSFSPNYKGSESDYGNNPSTGPNSSNGGCVTGTITYQDSILGTTCTQEVNSCFRTPQSFFNPDVPEIDENEGILGEDDKFNSVSTTNSVEYQRWNSSTNRWDIEIRSVCCSDNCDADTFCLPFIDTTGVCYYAYDSVYVDFGKWEARPIYDGVLSGEVTAIKAGGRITRDLSTTQVGDYSYYTGIRGASSDKSSTSITLIHEKTPMDQPENGVNIYLNIVDLEKKYNEEGLPYPGGCGDDRFTFSFGTEPCDESYCTSKLIATNVDINELGDISNLESKSWTK